MLDTTKYKGLVPDSTLETLVAWARTARPVGDFTGALLRNDLMETMARADLQNRARLHSTVQFIYNEMPRGSFGSEKAMAEWARRGGLEGIASEKSVDPNDRDHESYIPGWLI